ncbi:uncharacterized protein FOMMEDRAFT_154176 [Fomitiporia mediterranea MF3/22]|uniref:uncharacterized protein n=1 Tax=Fomitiporia mediterranea (strain MF3/22) TaxID=694068 RepID=UPI0004408100|nr:uncharacterized protein FOMMEDRAFT_154176 [Fomitiporia mediterranea MF3/22]EJD05014.1 hypothetical protein FOMMEDRAFT_154176 [Fomitiporia mediterranea MF3/22]
MSSDDKIEIEPHVLEYMKQVEQGLSPRASLAEKPLDAQKRLSPVLLWSKRRRSDPSHRDSDPGKPILKNSEHDFDRTLSPDWPLPRASIRRGNNVPLDFTTRKEPPTVDQSTNGQSGSNYTLDMDIGNDLFYTPKGILSEKDYDTDDGPTVEEYGMAYSGHMDDFYADPRTPLPTPKLRTSFKQDVPYQGYPMTPQNTTRVKRRPPPLVDELDIQQNRPAFPSRQFSAPAVTPSPSEFPLPPSILATGGSAGNYANRGQTFGTTSTGLFDPTEQQRRVPSWRPSFPSWGRRSSEKVQRPETGRTASKRKSNSGIEPDPKRRKVHFVLPPGHQEHPPMRRRPTPYYEPFSAKVKRVLLSFFKPFQGKSEEEKAQKDAAKAQKKAAKLQKKREKQARKEREELIESYRHFDDLVDE